MADDGLCAGCGLDLADLPGPREACPRCGETTRVFTASASIRGSGRIRASGVVVSPPTLALKVEIPSPNTESSRIAAHFAHVLDVYPPTGESGRMWLVVDWTESVGALPIVIVGDDRQQALEQLRDVLDDEL